MTGFPINQRSVQCSDISAFPAMDMDRSFSSEDDNVMSHLDESGERGRTTYLVILADVRYQLEVEIRFNIGQRYSQRRYAEDDHHSCHIGCQISSQLS